MVINLGGLFVLLAACMAVYMVWPKTIQVETRKSRKKKPVTVKVTVSNPVRWDAWAEEVRIEKKGGRSGKD